MRCFITSVLITTALAAAAHRPPLAILPQGVVRGSVDAHGNFVYLGIPYAQTAGGQNRWKPPQPLAPTYSGTFNATQYGPTCPQAISSSSNYSRQSEDCLNLNIWAPSNGTHLPVFVFMYGGAMVTGSSSNSQLQGTNFARKGVIYVNLNSRESIYASPNTASLPQNETQNFSILDVEAALDWIHSNIQAFGGDPDHIVFGGHSSGSVHVDHYLWNHPNTWLKGAWQASANVISGPAYAPQNFAFDTIAAEVGCPTSNISLPDQLICMRKVPFADFQTSLFNSSANTWFTPTIDNITRFSSQSYISRFNSGHYPSHVPLLTGNSAHEGRTFGQIVYAAENTNFTAWINSFDADVGQIPDEIILAAYPHNNTADSISSGKQYGDARFDCAVDYMLDLQSGRQKTWQYRFFGDYSNILGIEGIGAAHGTEVPFFHGGNECFEGLENVTESEQRLADWVHGWFVEWIKDPSGGPGWRQGVVGKIGVPGREEVVLEVGRGEFNGVCQEVYRPWFRDYPRVQKPV